MINKNPTIILRMTNACNLNCTYCYDKNNHISPQKENYKIIENLNDIVNNITKILYNENDRNKVIFHGGEPLLINADTYEKLISKILDNRPNTKFSIQTNGTLLTKEHITVFKKYNVAIGISLDGYDEETNRYRVYKNGDNSFKKVMEKINILNNENVKFGIIMSVSKMIIGHEQELYDFIYRNKLKCNIRPVFLSSEGLENVIMTNEDYYEFFKNIFEIWINDKEKIKFKQITELYEEFAKALEPKFQVKKCSCSGNCFENFISLDMDGELYSCNRNYNNEDFYYGNIKNTTMEEINRKTVEISKNRQNKILESKCKQCSLFEECKGGCPANAYIKYGSIYSSDDYFCEANIKIREYVKRRIRELNLLSEYKNGLENSKR